jgi:hypothetical protein
MSPRWKFRLMAAFSIYVAAPLLAHASPLILNPGQYLEIRFSGPSPTCSGGPCGALRVDYGSFSTAVSPGSMFCTSTIFDGTTKLGMEFCTGFSTLFVSHLSSFPNPSIQIDFTSINNGTIDGRIDVTATAQVTFNDPASIRVLLGPDWNVAGGGPLTVLSVTETPEPGALAPFTLAVMLALLRVRGRAFFMSASIWRQGQGGERKP